MSFIEFSDIYKEYRTDGMAIRALDGASFAVEKGELAVITRPPPARAKPRRSTYSAAWLTATSGSILVDGDDIGRYSTRDLVGYRRLSIGFVFQFYNLVPNLTALENVELAAQICTGAPKRYRNA